LQYIVYIKEYIVYNQNTNERRQEYAMKNKKLKLARVEKDMSQEDLANIVGVTRQTIGLIETGNYNPTLKLCIAICNALDKTLNDLFWEDLQ
jgi:putative transcriptional regulator